MSTKSPDVTASHVKMIKMLPPLQVKKHEEAIYQLADNDLAREEYQRIMDSFEDNYGSVAFNWEKPLHMLGRQIEIDLASGLTLAHIMPTTASVTEANEQADKRPSQIYDMMENRHAIVGHFDNVVQALILTAAFGPELYEWHKDHNKDENGKVIRNLMAPHL